MNKSQEILSQIVTFQKYAKYISELERRESWEEIVTRYLSMMEKKYPSLKEEIWSKGTFILNKKVLPSMRALQFAGKAIEKNESRIYNCSYLPVDDIHAFSETMYLSLTGTGVGYSVQTHHIQKLPKIQKPNKGEIKYLIGDSIAGWSDAVKVLIKSYFGYSKYKINFDYSDIRPKGSILKTAGGKAPGPEPLRICLESIKNILENIKEGDKIKPIEAHDIMCHIADSTLAGGIRRSALICLFSKEDEEMLTCKSGEWYINNPQRGRANNSVVLERNSISKEEYDNIFSIIIDSNAGEPGIYWTNDLEYGTNPCAEISLRPFTFCNLCEINVSDLKSKQDLYKRAEVASFFGTLQAGFTDFNYLRPIWKKNTKEDALIGVGMTGIASNVISKYNKRKVAKIVKIINNKYSKLIGINRAARTTTVKPSGTSSCILGTSSGIHAWYNDYYIRRIRINKNENLYEYLINNLPELIEDDVYSSDTTAVLSIPQKAPENSILRNESILDILERIKDFNINWVKAGHNRGVNTNNVSATVSVNKDDWSLVIDWMWNNKEFYNGITVLPYDGGIYKQAPFENIDEETYNNLQSKIQNINLNQVIEKNDETSLKEEIACAGGTCEIL